MSQRDDTRPQNSQPYLITHSTRARTTSIIQAQGMMLLLNFVNIFREKLFFFFSSYLVLFKLFDYIQSVFLLILNSLLSSKFKSRKISSSIFFFFLFFFLFCFVFVFVLGEEGGMNRIQASGLNSCTHVNVVGRPLCERTFIRVAINTNIEMGR